MAGLVNTKPSVRIGELGEAVDIMRRLWTEDVVDFEGKHYTLKGARCQPKPMQDPHIPLWVAGGGEQLTLNVAARFADYTNFGYTLDEFVHKSEVLRGHCEDVGRDFGSITRTTNFNIVIGEDEAAVAERTAAYKALFAPVVGEDKVDATFDNNHVRGGGVVGTPEQIVEHLLDWKDAGCEFAVTYFWDAAYDTASLELFAREVVPALA